MDEHMLDIKYWSERIKESSEAAEHIHARLYQIPCLPLSLNERIELRNVLALYKTLSDLLEDSVNTKLNAPPKPFWKRLFQK